MSEDERWSDGLSADLRESEYVKSHDSIESLVNEHVHAQGMIGRKGAIEPSADGSDIKDWAAYYTKTGRPENIEGYDLASLQRKEGVPVNTEAEAALVQEMFDSGASKRTVQNTLRRMVEITESGHDAGLQQIVANDLASQQNMKNEWGEAYHVKTVAADTALKHIMGDEAKAFGEKRLNDGTLVAQDPTFLKALAAMGSTLVEDTAIGGKRASMARTPDEGKADIAQLDADQGHQRALHDAGHPGHAEAQAKRTRAFKDAYPE